MKCTLYKDCILTPNYNEVFSSKFYFDKYLNTLDKSSFEVNDTYGIKNGSIYLDASELTYNINSYNYIKIETNYVTFYSFITDIDISNEIVTFTYEIDVWHTFWNWEFKRGILTNTKFIDKYSIPFYTYNLDPIGNKLSFDRKTPNTCAIIVSLMLYEASSYKATPTKIRKGLFLLREEHILNETPFYTNNISIDNIDTHISEIINTQSTAINNQSSSINKIYYELSNIYVIPFSMEDVSFRVGTTNINDVYLSKFNIGNVGDILEELDEQNLNLFDYNYKYEFGDVSFGLPSNLHNVYPSTEEFKYSIKAYLNDFVLIITEEFKGSINDITTYFNLNIPFDVTSGIELANRELVNEIQKQTIQNEKERSQYNMVSKVSGNVSSGIASMIANPLKGASYAMEKASQTAIDINNNIYNQSNLALQKNQIEQTLYSNGMSLNVLNTGLINTLYGVVRCYYHTDDIMNLEEVEKYIKEYGYNVNLFVNELKLPNANNIDDNDDFDFVKFSFIEIIGLPFNYNKVIEQILLKGVYLLTNV